MMRTSFTHAWQCAAMVSALATLPAAAADAIYQRTNPGASVELSNLDDGDAGQTKLVEGTAKAAAPAAAESTAMVAPAKVTRPKARRLPGKGKDANGADEEANADEESTTDETRSASDGTAADSASTAANDGSPQGQSGSAGGTGLGNGFSFSGGGMGTNGYATGGSGSSTGNTGYPANTGAGMADTGAGAGAGAGTGSTATKGGDAPLTGVSAILSQYRDLMLREAASANYMNTNPAISRRYLQVDRSTYQARIGQ
jgi:hypothetical protein